MVPIGGKPIREVDFAAYLKIAKNSLSLPPYEHSDLRARFPSHPHCFDPTLSVIELQDCLVSQDGFVLTSDGFFISDAGYVIKRERALKQLQAARTASHTPSIEEPMILVGGDSNFYHWHLNWLPRAALAQRFPELRDFRVLVRREAPQLVFESLAHWCNYGADRVLTMPGLVVRVKRLFVPVFFLNPVVSPFALRMFDSQGKLEGPTAHRRIFVRRANARVRRVVNEDELAKIAESQGFESVFTENLSYQDEISLFRETSHIVGAYGAGLTNMLFCRPGFSVLELVNGYFNKVYWTLALCLGARHFVRCPAASIIDNPAVTDAAQKVKDNDFEVDPRIFAEKLAAISS